MLVQHMLLAYLLGGSLLVALVAIPMVQGRVPRNPWYGFRVQKTLESDEIWYPANRYAGECLLTAGLVSAAALAAFWPFAGQLSVDVVALAGGALTLGPLAMATIASFLYLRRLD
jgi:hypothetical protein